MDYADGAQTNNEQSLCQSYCRALKVGQLFNVRSPSILPYILKSRLFIPSWGLWHPYSHGACVASRWSQATDASYSVADRVQWCPVHPVATMGWSSWTGRGLLLTSSRKIVGLAQWTVRTLCLQSSLQRLRKAVSCSSAPLSFRTFSPSGMWANRSAEVQRYPWTVGQESKIARVFSDFYSSSTWKSCNFCVAAGSVLALCSNCFHHTARRNKTILRHEIIMLLEKTSKAQVSCLTGLFRIYCLEALWCSSAKRDYNHSLSLVMSVESIIQNVTFEGDTINILMTVPHTPLAETDQMGPFYVKYSS